MKITRNAKIFLLINSATTVVFLLNLNKLVTDERFDEIAPWAIIYGLVWAITGAVLGVTDKTREYRGNIEVQYSLISSVVGLAALWLSKIFLPAVMPIGYGYILFISLIIVAASVVQYYVSNKDPKGVRKEEIFK